jgi:UDP-GlcNAc:undecaprenyl-phosphate GlcNAc-1-phosphate transferase
MNISLNGIINFLTSFFLSLLSILILKKISLKFNSFRSKKEVPFVGGIGFIFSFIVSFLYFILLRKISLPFYLFWILLFSFSLFIIELIDDLKDFSLRIKITIQIIFVTLFLLYGKKIQIYFFPYWLNYMLSFLWIMGIMNAFNHLDIGDGLCGGISLITGISFFTIAIISNDLLLAYLLVSLIGALSAFLLFNFPPAKIIMGNSGSHFLGFLFATLSMYGDYATLENPYAIIIPILLLGFPIIDTIFLIIVRLKRGILPLRKSNDHIFLKLSSLGLSRYYILFIIYLNTFLWCLSGVFLLLGFGLLSFITIIFAILLTLKLIFSSYNIRTNFL